MPLDRHTMRLLAFLLLVGLVLAQMPPIPEIVKQFTQTTALWEAFEDTGRLPVRSSNVDHPLFDLQDWHAFLRTKGKQFIQEQYVYLPSGWPEECASTDETPSLC